MLPQLAQGFHVHAEAGDWHRSVPVTPDDRGRRGLRRIDPRHGRLFHRAGAAAAIGD